MVLNMTPGCHRHRHPSEYHRYCRRQPEKAICPIQRRAYFRTRVGCGFQSLATAQLSLLLLNPLFNRIRRARHGHPIGDPTAWLLECGRWQFGQIEKGPRGDIEVVESRIGLIDYQTSKSQAGGADDHPVTQGGAQALGPTARQPDLAGSRAAICDTLLAVGG